MGCILKDIINSIKRKSFSLFAESVFVVVSCSSESAKSRIVKCDILRSVLFQTARY
jgi:hypothetical protein